VLEAMEEHSGHPSSAPPTVLDPPYIVLATTESDRASKEPTRCPKRRWNRFIFKVVMGSPKPDELREILNRTPAPRKTRFSRAVRTSHAPRAIEDLKALVREGDGGRAARALHHQRESADATPGGPGAIPEVSHICASARVRAVRRP